MARFLTTRRSEWLPGIFAGMAVAALLSLWPGPRPWLVYGALLGAALLALGRLTRLRRRRAPEPSAPRPRARARVVQGPQSGRYNLADDNRTDSQKYVM